MFNSFTITAYSKLVYENVALLLEGLPGIGCPEA
jgi:hypothetical protein